MYDEEDTNPQMPTVRVNEGVVNKALQQLIQVVPQTPPTQQEQIGEVLKTKGTRMFQLAKEVKRIASETYVAALTENTSSPKVSQRTIVTNNPVVPVTPPLSAKAHRKYRTQQDEEVEQESPQVSQSSPQPIRVIGMEHKYEALACLREFLMPGFGFIYAESVNLGVGIAFVTIPLTIYLVYYYLTQWLIDFQNSLGYIMRGDPGEFTNSDHIKMLLLGAIIVWFIIRAFWVVNEVKIHNAKIAELADVGQLIQR